MTDERRRSTDSEDLRFPRALSAEVDRRLEIDPPLDEPSALADLHMRITAAEKHRQRGVDDVMSREGRFLAPRLFRGGVGVLRSQTLRMGLWIGAVAVVVGSVITATRTARNTDSGVTRVYTTSAHQQAIVNLDDKTRVTLAPQTTLRLQHFGTQSRTVVLDEGEAYFEVAHSSGVPFIVRTGVATAQVLGTAFLVRHGDRDSHVRIAVIDGKVRVTTSVRVGIHPGDGVTLTAGQAGDVTDSTMRTNTTDDLAPGTEWAPGRIIFHNTPVATVLQAVSQWYGYQFRYADTTLRRRSVTMMVSTRSSAEALATIEQILAVNLTVVGDTVTLVPQPPRTQRNAPRIRTYDVWTATREVGR